MWRSLIGRWGDRALWLLVAAMFLVPLGGMGWFLYRTHILLAHGLTAPGVVVDGEAGTTADHTPYCVERLEFRDHRGVLRRAARECAARPEMAARATVYYAPDDPSKTYVEGDQKPYAIVFFFLILGLFALKPILSALLRFFAGPSDDEPPAGTDRFKNRAQREGKTTG